MFVSYCGFSGAGTGGGWNSGASGNDYQQSYGGGPVRGGGGYNSQRPTPYGQAGEHHTLKFGIDISRAIGFVKCLCHCNLVILYDVPL